MRTLGNILWHVPFLGFLSALGTFLIGGLLVITVIGAPLGLGLIQLSKFLLTPFSSAMISKKDLKADQNKLWQTFGIIVRILYFPFGLFFSNSAMAISAPFRSPSPAKAKLPDNGPLIPILTIGFTASVFLLVFETIIIASATTTTKLRQIFNLFMFTVKIFIKISIFYYNKSIK